LRFPALARRVHTLVHIESPKRPAAPFWRGRGWSRSTVISVSESEADYESKGVLVTQLGSDCKNFFHARDTTGARVIFASQPELDWHTFFGRAAPVEVEIGCGKGAFLLEYARTHPQYNLLGIENQPRWSRWIAERLARSPLSNVRLLCANAALVIARFVRDDSVHAYHLYFPDPWWKRRHHKRRLVRSDFAMELLRTLEPGGTLHVATDVSERFDAMLAELTRAPFMTRIETGPTPAGRPFTNFERKYRAEGRLLHYVTATKPPR
jgi:tRNA (guanine-N7-)-methyltransferase